MIFAGYLGSYLGNSTKGEEELNFWICQHLESGDKNFAHAPAPRPCSGKMVPYLLDLVGIPKFMALGPVA